MDGNFQKTAGRIAAWITGVLTGKEQDELERWRKESVENEQIFQELTRKQGFEKNQECLEKFPVEDAWKGIEGKLNIRSRKTVPLLHYWKYVAVLLICLGMGGVYWKISHTAKVETTVLSSVIPAGVQGARLTLGDGRVIQVSPEECFSIAEADGTLIHKQTSGIDYQQADTGKGQEVYNCLETLTGMEYSLTLADGTQVFLNAGSLLKFPVAFRGEKRVVELQGEAYFTVAKDAAHPFIVRMEGTEVVVVGTSFNARSYENEDYVVTTLVEGRVKINNRNIVPGEQAMYEKQTRELKVRQVDVNQYIAWKNGRFVFRNERLEDVMKILSRWYGVEYHFLDDAAKEVNIGASLGRYNDMSPIIDMLKHTDLVEVLQTNRCIYISAEK